AYVLGIDTDAGALKIAEKNAEKFGVAVEFRQGDIGSDSAFAGASDAEVPFEVPFDTVVMNPPFGAQNGSEHADRPFIDARSIRLPLYILQIRTSMRFVKACWLRSNSRFRMCVS
ncbi:MAG: methyltransferase, partial [Eubacterium sp.]|nr:methyltransferase [Eubacterium sp.]